MTMQRAYAVMTVKAMDEKKRTFVGTATTPTTDRMGDIVEPKGMEFKLPLPLLWQHDSTNPIGWVRKAKVSADGIEVECEVASIEEEGPLKQRLAEYWQMLNTGLVRGLSIGFNVLESSRIEGTYGYRFTRTAWLELSAVTIAANAECSIHSIKSLSEQHLAALGRKGSPPGDRPRPGASGQSQQPPSGGFFHSRSQKGNVMKTLKDLLEQKAARTARQTEIVKAWEDQDHERTDEERDELDAIDVELKSLDDDIRIARMRERHASGAREVRGASTEEGSGSRVAGGMGFVRKEDPDDKFKGQSFTRFLIAKAQAFVAMKDGNFISPVDIAKHRWGKTHPKLVEFIRTAVAGGGTGSGEWGAELAQSDARYTGDFVDFLYAMTIFDRLPLREVPARVHIKGQDGAATGYWVGESKAIPVSKADFSDVELTPLKVAAMAVCSKELVADSSPSAEMWIRDSIGQASAQRVDTTFLSSTAASAGVSPAGILNGLSAASPSGTDADAVRADLMTLYTGFLAAKNATGLVQIMTPSMAKALQLLRNSLGQREFPDIRADGGSLEGDTVYTGDNVTPGDWILLKPSDIWKIGDTGVDVSMSDQATIEQNDAPQGAGDTPTAASATLMSLWQTDQIGFKVVRRINFKLRRATSVAYLANAEYGGVVS